MSAEQAEQQAEQKRAQEDQRAMMLHAVMTVEARARRAFTPISFLARAAAPSLSCAPAALPSFPLLHPPPLSRSPSKPS